MYKRQDTKKIKVGNIYIGASDNVIIQSMCNTKTSDVKATISQIKALEKMGCELVRVTVPDVESAKAIEEIKKEIDIPLVADIHFDYKLALMSIERGIDKVRINPGNIGSDEKIKEVVKACKVKNIPIRIGVNSGSVPKDILLKYDGKVNSQSLVETAKREVEKLEQFDFTDIIVSIKSSDVMMSIKAYESFAEMYRYPLHIGITEAGTLYSGNIKSSIGLGILLYEGIGDTMRVSLTGSPMEEIKTARLILKTLGIRNSGIDIVSCPTCGRTNIDVIAITNEVEKRIEQMILDGKIDREKKLKVAIMGCAVNGPGEAREADIAIAGGKGEGLLIKKGEIVEKIKENDMIERLLKEIEKITLKVY